MTLFDPEQRGAVQLTIYAKSLAHELRANAFKGSWQRGRDGKHRTDKDLLSDLVYHVIKLGMACAKPDAALVAEYAADVGNCAMFLAEKHGALSEDLWRPVSESRAAAAEIRQDPDAQGDSDDGDVPTVLQPGQKPELKARADDWAGRILRDSLVH
jgi:hypothetical protein